MVDFQLALGVDVLPAQVVDFQLAQVEDDLPAQVADFQLAQVADVLPDQVEDFQLAQVVVARLAQAPEPEGLEMHQILAVNKKTYMKQKGSE